MDNICYRADLAQLECECINLHVFDSGSEMRAELAYWISYYNARRPHSTLDGRTPDEAHTATGTEKVAA